MEKEVVELTWKLQAELEKMTPKQFKKWMKTRKIKYNGKEYGYAEIKKKTVQ
jgi:hypothetical protein